MSSVTNSIVFFGFGVVHAFDCCLGVVNGSIRTISTTYRHEIVKVQRFARDHFSPTAADVVDRVAAAVPEAFVAVSALFGGFLTIPALIILWTRKIVLMRPMFFQSILESDTSNGGLSKLWQDALWSMDDTFERLLVPALFVAFAVDALYCFTLGCTVNTGWSILHGTTIAVPCALLAFRYMMRQGKERADGA